MVPTYTVHCDLDTENDYRMAMPISSWVLFEKQGFAMSLAHHKSTCSLKEKSNRRFSGIEIGYINYPKSVEIDRNQFKQNQLEID